MLPPLNKVAFTREEKYGLLVDCCMAKGCCEDGKVMYSFPVLAFHICTFALLSAIRCPFGDHATESMLGPPLGLGLYMKTCLPVVASNSRTSISVPIAMRWLLGDHATE